MWFTNLLTNGGVGTTVLMLAISIFLGLLLGKIKVKGITLGITWVLFVGIGLSAVGVACNHDMLHIIKEFGLILFVTAVGLQVGPGFFHSFKKGGLAILNFLYLLPFVFFFLLLYSLLPFCYFLFVFYFVL